MLRRLIRTIPTPRWTFWREADETPGKLKAESKSRFFAYHPRTYPNELTLIGALVRSGALSLRMTEVFFGVSSQSESGAWIGKRSIDRRLDAARGIVMRRWR
jgi:hypothetical protein